MGTNNSARWSLKVIVDLHGDGEAPSSGQGNISASSLPFLYPLPVNLLDACGPRSTPGDSRAVGQLRVDRDRDAAKPSVAKRRWFA